MSLANYLSTVFITLICIQLVQSKIYRSECRKEVLFKATDRDKVLILSSAGVLKELTDISLPHCGQRCTSNNQCRSMNFKIIESRKCQLLKFDKQNQSVILQNAPGWIHYEPTNQVGPRCRLVTCKAGFQCVETCNNLVGYECIDIDECQSNPCMNGATCSNLLDKYTCTCVAGYTGTNCETDINECSSSPCKNGGSCSDLLNRYTCTCAPGYTGTNCETDINECNSSPCQNGGTCQDLVNRYSCTCPGGYVGTNCQTDFNECSSTPCQNGGTCNNLVNSYSCTCVGGYSGTNCQTASTACTSYATLNENTRSVNYIDGTAICDSGLATQWYRFASPAGTQMLTSCPSGYGTQYRCKTHGGGWLNGAHPSVGEGEVERTVCFAWGNCCGLSKKIKVKNCGGFFVYYLGPPGSCSYRYCGN